MNYHSILTNLNTLSAEYKVECSAESKDANDWDGIIQPSHFDDLLNYDEFLADIAEALKRKPNSPIVLSLAYEGALHEGDDARRLHWAIKLVKVSDNPNHYFRYGVELARNLMIEKAQDMFRKGLEKNGNHVWCLNGLGQCFLQQLDLDEAADCFQKSLKIEETDLAKNRLRYIDSLQDGKSKAEIDKKRRKLIQQQAEDQLMPTSVEQQKIMIAKVLIGKT